jgi:hypothetical protein
MTWMTFVLGIGGVCGVFEWSLRSGRVQSFQSFQSVSAFGMDCVAKSRLLRGIRRWRWVGIIVL